MKSSAEDKLKAVEEGKTGMDPKLDIQPVSTNGKAQFGSIEHIQQVENRRAVKVVSPPELVKAYKTILCCAVDSVFPATPANAIFCCHGNGREMRRYWCWVSLVLDRVHQQTHIGHV